MSGALALWTHFTSAKTQDVPIVCLTGNTSIFFAEQKTCASIEREDETGQKFFIQAHLVGAESQSTTRPTVVFVPGGPGDSGSDLFQSFEARSFPGAFQKHLNVNTIYYDPRGTGQSSVGPHFATLTHKTFSTENNVDDVKAILDHFGIRSNVILLAHSAGGAIATRFAEKYPSLVSGLILYSAVSTLRTTGEIIKSYEGENFELWKESLKSRGVTPLEIQELESLYKQVEREIINEKLLWIQGHISEVKLTKKSVFVFRHLAHKAAIEGKEAFLNFLKGPQAQIESLPNLPRAAPITEDVLFAKTTTSPLHLRSVLFCAEALNQADLEESFYYPGVNLSYLCRDKVVHTQSVRAPRLESIQVPTLVLAGEVDTHVPAYLQKRTAEALPRAQYVSVLGAGHTFHNTHPMPFLKAIQDFLNHF